MYWLTERFGTLLMLLACLALIAGLAWSVPSRLTLTGFVSVILMQFAVGAAMTYASRQKIRGTEIGHKVYPATLVAFLLWLLIFCRWWMV